MTDILQQASDWLEAKRSRFATRSVVYQRGAATVEVLATVGRTVFETDNGYGVVEKTESRDFLISAADLALDSVETLPQRGDRIRETLGAATFVYEVMAPGKESHWRYSDPGRKTLRIHTKHVDTETV